MRYVALKVLNVEATAGVLYEQLHEVKSLLLITDTDPAHPGRRHCLQLRNAWATFSHWGPHICIVTNVLGTDIMRLRAMQPDRAFTVATTKRIIKQTLIALDYIHTKCGLVHTGENLLIHSCSFDPDSWSRCQTR